MRFFLTRYPIRVYNQSTLTGYLTREGLYERKLSKLHGAKKAEERSGKAGYREPLEPHRRTDRGDSEMVEEDRYCDDVLIQLSAVDKAIKGLANLVLDAHMHTCLVENIRSGNEGIIDEIVDLFKRFQ